MVEAVTFDTTFPCKARHLVNCKHDERDVCSRCGWNPAVEDRRILRLSNGGLTENELGHKFLMLKGGL